MEVNRFRELPILGILRGITSESVKPLTETVVSSGLKTIEITMNTPDAPALIRQMSDAAGDRLTIGAGTVLSLKVLHSALDAGATFIVMPVLVPDVMEYCVKNSIPVFPGALTPQEIYNAWNAGATMVKVFPAKFFGP
ncbi:MAG: 2-dehydro-3-deoxyphosphogluconate aldolase, partial [Nitrospirae bacterium]|nr:2-dehydro-3-deoxyphosphogluconate aldolase [Nitrospirota bacterium]